MSGSSAENGIKRGVDRGDDDGPHDADSPLLSSPNQDGPRSPADKVRYMLSPEAGDSEPQLAQHSLFCQMDTLIHFEDGDELGWKEMARWLKYEEKVDAGDRWSKPHVSTTSLHALFEIRKAISENTAIVDLNMDASHSCIHQVAEKLVDTLRDKKTLTPEQLDKVLYVLTRPHKHKHRKADKSKMEENKAQESDAGKGQGLATKNSIVKQLDFNSNEGKKKKKKFQKKDDLDKVVIKEHLYPKGVTPSDLKPYKPNKRMLSKIPKTAEVANVLVGQVDFLQEPIMALIRLSRGTLLGDISEVAIPTRFVFLVLGPPDSSTIYAYEEVGRAMASMFADKVFCEVAYNANNREDIVDGIDEYIDDLTVLPPSVWDPKTRLEPPNKTIGMDKVRKRLIESTRHGGEPDAIDFKEAVSGDPSLVRTGRPFGGMLRDMKARYRHYKSDITDAFSIQCLASVVFLYFACITPIVTFGGLLSIATDGQLGTMECILSGAICGLSYALFSGQPLTIMGATGPLLIFESLLYAFCIDYDINFLAFRFWTGVWITAILLIMVAFDLSFLVKYITRFTEESFSLLISLIFIMEAFKKVIHVLDKAPVDTDTIYDGEDYLCHCVMPPPGNETEQTVLDHWSGEASNTTEPPPPMTHPFNWTKMVGEDCINYLGKVVISHDCLSEEECEKHHWDMEGPACSDHTTTFAVPDVFFLSLFLFIATFSIAYFFRSFRTAPYLTGRIRSTIADFAVLMSILICTGIDIGMGLATPKLMVPEEFQTTVPGRGWVVNPANIDWYLVILSLLPAALATILIFLDQQITAVIINRKDHKLKKPPGYHLDLFVLAVEIFVCSLLGLPWFVAATVRSITHVKSLVRQSEISAPGEKPVMLGIREQRVTGFFIHILIAVSVLMTSILKYVPMPVLYGVFLYMGVTSLSGVQFVDRIKILAMPAKYQPDFIYLRHVELKRVHIFTGIQIIGMIGMWVVKSIKAIAIAFPLMVLALCFLRKAMDFLFTQGELYWLDHILPDEERRKKEDDIIEELKEEYDEEDLPQKAKAKKAHSGQVESLIARRNRNQKPRKQKKSLFKRSSKKKKPSSAEPEETNSFDEDEMPAYLESFTDRKLSV